jgi:hypothetical protein
VAAKQHCTWTLAPRPVGFIVSDLLGSPFLSPRGARRTCACAIYGDQPEVLKWAWM